MAASRVSSGLWSGHSIVKAHEGSSTALEARAGAFPLGADAVNQALNKRLAAKSLKQRVTVGQQGVIDRTAIDPVFEPPKRPFAFARNRKMPAIHSGHSGSFQQ